MEVSSPADTANLAGGLQCEKKQLATLGMPNFLWFILGNSPEIFIYYTLAVIGREPSEPFAQGHLHKLREPHRRLIFKWQWMRVDWGSIVSPFRILCQPQWPLQLSQRRYASKEHKNESQFDASYSPFYALITWYTIITCPDRDNIFFCARYLISLGLQSSLQWETNQWKV